MVVGNIEQGALVCQLQSAMSGRGVAEAWPIDPKLIKDSTNRTLTDTLGTQKGLRILTRSNRS
jgi:hypothetical protein